jgi:hypothetical protein
VRAADSLTPALLGRETRQLAVAAALTLAALLFAPHWLRLVAGLLDAALAAVCLVALVVAWRAAASRTPAFAVYASGAVLFALLALLNFAA